MLSDWRHMLVRLPARGPALLVIPGHDLGTTFHLLLIFPGAAVFSNRRPAWFAGILIFMPPGCCCFSR